MSYVIQLILIACYAFWPFHLFRSNTNKLNDIRQKIEFLHTSVKSKNLSMYCLSGYEIFQGFIRCYLGNLPSSQTHPLKRLRLGRYQVHFLILLDLIPLVSLLPLLSLLIPLWLLRLKYPETLIYLYHFTPLPSLDPPSDLEIKLI